MAVVSAFAAVSPVIPAVLPVVLWPDCVPVDCAGCDCCAVVLPVEGFVVWVAGEPEDCFAGAGADCFGLLGFVAGAGVVVAATPWRRRFPRRRGIGRT